MKSRIRGIRFLLLFTFVACVGPIADAASTGDFYRDVSRLNRILLEIDRKYVEEVSSRALTDAAVEGLRNVLDPHTIVFDPSGYDDLKVTTDGEFGGLGITIAIRDRVLTVISPLQGTPAFRAGLQAGDRILKIDAITTKGMTVDAAVDKLRGKVGSEVELTVMRNGLTEPMKVKLTRDKIVIHSVPYHGMIDTANGVGYVKVVTFAKKTSDDVAAALEDLKSKGMKKLVLDLRYNPGGLLQQAIDMSNLFLEKDRVIVSTRGRTQQTEARSENEPLVDRSIPIVVLVNQGSASASEIVAGALQDWDRALVLGDTTFGKGSVQTIYPLDKDGFAIKLTTAFYYLPMGRCINRPENGIHGGAASQIPVEEDDETLAADDSSKADSAAAVPDTARKVFHTANGRAMYGAGGIAPDLMVGLDTLDVFEQVLERQSMFFKFAVLQRPLLEKKGVKVSPTWNVPEELVNAFLEYVDKDTTFAKIKAPSEGALDYLTETLGQEFRLEGDSAKIAAQVAPALENLKQALKQRRKDSLVRNQEYIKRGLKREILAAMLDEQASTAYSLQFDRQVLEAIKQLKDEKSYKSLLSPAGRPTAAAAAAPKNVKGEKPAAPKAK